MDFREREIAVCFSSVEGSRVNLAEYHLGINCFLLFEDYCDFVSSSLLPRRFPRERESLKDQLIKDQSIALISSVNSVSHYEMKIPRICLIFLRRYVSSRCFLIL